jgi:hypothetical protein
MKEMNNFTVQLFPSGEFSTPEVDGLAQHLSRIPLSMCSIDKR